MDSETKNIKLSQTVGNDCEELVWVAPKVEVISGDETLSGGFGVGVENTYSSS